MSHSVLVSVRLDDEDFAWLTAKAKRSGQTVEVVLGKCAVAYVGARRRADAKESAFQESFRARGKKSR